MQHYLDDVIETIKSYFQRVTPNFFELGMLLMFLAIIVLFILTGTR